MWADAQPGAALQSTSRPKPRRPSHRLAALYAASVCLFAPSVSIAQQAVPPEARANLSGSAAITGLRLGAPTDLSNDLRRPSTSGPSRTLAPSPSRTFYDLPPSNAETERARLNNLDGIIPGEEVEPSAPAVEEPFDILDGPAEGSNGRRAAGPDNLASAPAPAAGIVPDSAAVIRDDREKSPSGRSGDLLIDAQRRNVRSLDLAVPASTVTARSTSSIGGRINLPVTGLRPSVPLARDDAFAPVGNRFGIFVLYSTLEQSIGASTNLSLTPGGASGAFSETDLSLRLLSDWSIHQAELNGLVSYRRNFEGILESDPKLSLDGRLRLDVDRLTTATFTGAVQYRREDPADLTALDLASDRPDILAYSAGAKLERAVGRTLLELDATSLREVTSADDPPGFQRLDETYTTTTLGLRAGYELSPALKPFVAGSIGKRMFDEDLTFAGTERDSLIQALRGGIAFDLGEKFLGEVAAGYAWSVPDDTGLETVGAPTIDARIAWSPQRGTDLVFSAVTSFEPDTLTSSTTTLYEGGLALRHRVASRTDLNGALSVAYRDADIASERETRYAAEAGFVHWLNRTLAITGLVRHERLDKDSPGGDYDADSIRIGVRVQR